MTELTRRFELKDELASMVEALRGDMSSEDFLRVCTELGLHAVQEEAARIAQDRVLAACVAQSDDFKRYRDDRRVKLGLPRPALNPVRPAQP